MLHKFLKNNKKEILLLSEERTRHLAGLRGVSDLLNQGVPLFYDQLITVLEEKLNNYPPEAMLSDASAHGEEFLRLGYSLSHVVHAYGAMCQAITELATIKNANISPAEFNTLNSCLDVAIAAAVSEFHFRSREATAEQEVKTLGFLAHELRNALSSATVAHEMIKVGLVGTGGSTAMVLEENLSRMRHLIDRSLSAVRMRAEAEVFVEKFRLSDLFDQVCITARIDAKKKNQDLTAEVSWKIEIESDRQLLISAIANLVQNAIKYTKSNGKIWLRGELIGERVFITVEDECGGIDLEKVDALFRPFVQAHSDRSGLGLGLAITQKAIHLCQGKLSVEDKPGASCIFTIEIPKKLIPGPRTSPTVKGTDSVQPDFRRKKK